MPWTLHLAVILLLALIAAVRFHPMVLTPKPRTDERVYLAAFRAVSAGQSPYAVTTQGLDFYYPPTFAALGAAALEAAGERPVVIAMRIANVLGLACCLWCAALFLPAGWRWSLAAAVLYVMVSPVALHHGLRSGNVSFAVSGAVLVALSTWRRSAWLSGVLLGLSAIIKPIAPVGLTTLAAHRPAGGGRRHLLAAATGLALGGAAALASPYLIDYLRVDGDIDTWPLTRSVSLYRWLHLTGLAVPPAGLVLVVALASAWLARREPMRPRRLYVLAIAAMTLATPALWSHTLLLTLPLQAMALARAWRRLRSRPADGSRWVLYEAVLVVLAVLALQFADGIGGGHLQAATPFQLAGLAVPVAAPAALAVYVWKPRRRASGGARPLAG